MSNKEFERLVENRKNWVRSSKENKFDFGNILAVYNDPSHFIYEILQNAEDAKDEKVEGAKKVKFELFEDRLDVYHDGADFDFMDIEGVTGIGISKKKEDLTSIGKFGFGFKSVFAVTETPCIFSGEYKIKIEDFVIPSVISSSEQIEKTLIRLPFNHKLRSPKEVFMLISKKLENIGLKTLLFLKNIEEIKWVTPSTSGHYLKSSENFQGTPNVKRVTITSSGVSEEYIVIGKPIKIEDKDLRVEVAYKLGKDKNGKEIIIPELDSKLVVYFPTEKVTYLNFVIQGPYKTTPNRGDIPLEDTQNKIVLEETANLVAESLSVIKDLGYLDTNFLKLLPIDPEYKEKELIYSVIYNKLKEKFLSGELLPTFDGKYTKASDALLARGKELTEFLGSNDIQNLFSKRRWLDTNITYDKTRKLGDYLTNELGVPEVDFENFARKITAEFLQTKSDEWMTDFYSRLLDQQALWSDREYSKGILRTKPIIRLENGEHIAPFDNNGKAQVYLPTETKSKYKTVKHIFTENENSLKFLEEIDLIKPDLLVEIREFILPKYLADNPAKDEWYFEDFEKLLKAYETISADKKREFIEELSKASFIDSVKNDMGENLLSKPAEAYFNDNDLKDYFEGYNSIYFVADGLHEAVGEKRLKSFLTDLGVEDKPRRIEIAVNLPKEEKERLRGNKNRVKTDYQKSYEYIGLENFMLHRQMTPTKSYLLWRLLLKNIEKLNQQDAKDFFEGTYGYQMGKHHPKKGFEAKFLQILKQQAWLIDKNNNFRKPSEINPSDLSDDYFKERPNIDTLIKVLEFKSGIIDQLPENDRKILEIVKGVGLTPEELERLISTKKEPLEKEKTWTPKHDPDTIKVAIEEGEPDKIITPDLTGQGGQIGTGEDNEPTNNHEKPKKKDVHITPNDRKAIGICGERHVYNALKEEFQELGSINETDSGFKVVNSNNEEFEIVWLNKDHDRGKGCDFVIRKDGTEIRYIEVKAKTQETGELIEVTGTQWEFARKLFEQNEGEKYSFYVVLNTGQANPRIKIRKNPIKLWKEGKLYAHPVNFKL